MIYPVALGEGKRLFRGADATKRLRLTESRPTSTGVLLLTYMPESAS